MSNTTEMPVDANSFPMQCLSLDVNVNLTTSGTAQDSANAPTGVKVVRVAVSEATYVAIGLSATATNADTIMLGGTFEYFRIEEGERVSLLQVSTGGAASITMMR